MSTPRVALIPAPGLRDINLADIEGMRLLLAGSSVIDWQRLSFADEPAADRFLRVNELDPHRQDDIERLEELRESAVEYLTRQLGYRIPPEVAHELPARQLFMLASSRGRRQAYACIVLKVMHVMHHLDGRELLFRLPISNNEVFGFVERKVVREVEAIRAAGFPIVEFAWSRKEHDSVVTKLLAKRQSIAANVFDKLRFRLVTRTVNDLAPVLHQLILRLVPFNYVIPGESINGILPFRRLVEKTPALARYADQLQLDREADGNERRDLVNEFSGPGYRVINFVVDMPVRIDEHLCQVRDPLERDLGQNIFVLTEFQVVDADTARGNEEGENSHQKYKERQFTRVKDRLEGGRRPDDATGPVDLPAIADHELGDDD